MTGQDGLRDEIAAAVEALRGTVINGRTFYTMPKWVPPVIADAVLPVVQAHIDAAREQVAEPWASLTEQHCAEGVHVKWYVDDEDAHACPWCVEESLQLRLDAANDRYVAAVARAEAAEQAVQRVRNLHSPLDGPYCRHDRELSPCITMRALDGPP